MLFKHCGDSVILSKSYVYFGFDNLGFNFVIYFGFNKFDFNFVLKAWTPLMRARSTGQRSIEAPEALVDALGALRCPNAVFQPRPSKRCFGRGYVQSFAHDGQSVSSSSGPLQRSGMEPMGQAVIHSSFLDLVLWEGAEFATFSKGCLPH